MIVVLSQRDIRHPHAGGAEKYTHNALIRLASEHKVVHLSVGAPGLLSEETIDGIHCIRKGTNLLSLIWHAYRYCRSHRSQISLIIDHCNTHQFLTFLWARKKRVFFIHQLTQEIWRYFYGPVLGTFLRLLEEGLLRMSRGASITVSKSTKEDLVARGYKNVYICPEGNDPRFKTLPENPKGDYLVYTGRLVPYKRVEDAIRLAAAVNRELIIVGRGQKSYERKLARLASELRARCRFAGFVSFSEKEKLVSSAYMNIMPSVREGWGLVITEAANMGTPSIVYPVPGTIEAVDYGKAGFVTDNVGYQSLIETFTSVTEAQYNEMRDAAFRFSLSLSWERTSHEFCEIVKGIISRKMYKKDLALRRSPSNRTE